MVPVRRRLALSRRGRRLLRVGALVAAAALAWPWRLESWVATSLVLPALSPFVVLGGAAAARSASLLVLLTLPIIVLIWILPRALCTHLCPVGLLQEFVARARRGGRGTWRRCPAVGPWLALTTFAGAALGYPLFLWLDPLAIFNGALNAWRLPLTATSVAAGAGLPLLLLLELARPQLWCRRLCPLGATQDLVRLGRRRLHRLFPHPRPVTAAGRSADGLSPRRAFFATCGGAAGAWAARSVRAQPPPLRPPGALPEAEFTGVCVRCGNCAQACPARIIQPDLAGGLTGLFAPRLSFAAGYCREECHRCHQVCPSGAIARLSLAEKRRAIIGLAHVDYDTCLMAQGRECNACVQACPYEALAIAAGPDGFSSRPIVDAERCNGCGACEAACPVTPARAIVVRSLSVRPT
jgi:ferredoxin-type protein NapF